MLSIGKLATGQADYYLEQAQGSVTRAGAVSSGVEDYYVGGHESAGEWIGGGAAMLRLRGEVDSDALHRVLAGGHPGRGLPLARCNTSRVPGFDLTFSAPKSVSVLFGVGDASMRRAILASHDAAVADAFDYVERHAAVTRRGAGGVHRIAGRGLVAAAFRHRASRAGDPQLHTHVLVANVTLGADGRWSALDGRQIYAHAKTAGYLYEARLRAELTRELGVAWTPVRNGIADLDGVAPAVLRAFSRRRVEIEAEMDKRGTRSAAVAQVATLETRRSKDYRVVPEQLVPEWLRRAASLGLTPERVRRVARRGRVAEPGRWDEERLADRLAAPDGLTHRRSTFTRRDVIQQVCEEIPAGVAVTAAEIEDVADRFLRSERAVVLAVGTARPDGLRRKDGRVVPLVPDERVYSTPELLALEKRVLDGAVGAQAAGVAVARDEVVERAIRERSTIAGAAADARRRSRVGRGGPRRYRQDVRAVCGSRGVGAERLPRCWRGLELACGAGARGQRWDPEHECCGAANAAPRSAGECTAAAERDRGRRGRDGLDAGAR
jgi:conjugative relaxase-like TrwC/TraI family protein